jgi:guanosine-3',5'-bis(diphosphate) 3'-pyrophosphohydrolase
MDTDDNTLKDKEKETAEDKMIDDAFQRLLDSYLASRHRKKVDIITKAFNFARQAHKGVRRLSGEPYIMHPIAVAQIASEEMGLGSTSICAAHCCMMSSRIPTTP